MSTEFSFFDTCHLALTPMVASKSDHFTPRRAVDSRGQVGSFYDAGCDQVLLKKIENFVLESLKSKRVIACGVRPLKTLEPLNLLRSCNMHHELRVSVSLQMVQEMGVGALINYSRPIDKYTRHLVYSCFMRTDYLSDEDFSSLIKNKRPMPDIQATHIIVLVNWGIDAIAILQLPSDDELAHKIDHVLNNICILLDNKRTDVMLTDNEKSLLEKIEHTEIFSNIPQLCQAKSISKFCDDIPQVLNDTRLIKPYNYNLCSIETFYTKHNNRQNIFQELGQDHVITLENHILHLSAQMKRLKMVMDSGHPNLQRQLQDQRSDARTKYLNLEGVHMREIQRIHDLVIGVRLGTIRRSDIPQILHNDKKKELLHNIDDLEYELQTIQRKEGLINDLRKQQFEYRSITDREIRYSDDQQQLDNKLLADKVNERIICSNDDLYKTKQPEWKNICQQLLQEREQNPHVQFIYADFTYSSYKLDDFIRLPSIIKRNNKGAPKPVRSSPPLKPTKSDDTINILLLGETGVGKSTFINAFVNYLVYESLDEARKKPIVLIPVSFLMTYDDDFKEKQVTFGALDESSNEDYSKTGGSVTQHCRSYLFTLKEGAGRGRKLRIIDSPGIGDVRGLAQDEINMQHILSYITNLTHLDAICILMKPNNTRLTIFFRACLIQLFDLFGDNARKNIIFCFTNARSTFYSPGNTGPLLKNLLQSLPVKDILFTKDNTFCFDSESFRYLVAVQNGIPFEKSEEEEYKESWVKSSTESKRFLEFVSTKITTSVTFAERQSMKGAQLRINLMIRPILETIRNTLRNIVLCNSGSRTTSIEIRPRIVKEPTAICLSCPRPILQVGDFWIVTDGLHIFDNKCKTCKCSPDDHYSIDYQLGYKEFKDATGNSLEDLTKIVHNLCEKSAEFAHFLTNATDTTDNDVFLRDIERMINEEDNICKRKAPCPLNVTLLNALKQFKDNYYSAKKKVSSKKEDVRLSDVYAKIEEVNKYPMIELQMNAIKEWHRYMLKHYEYEVPV